MQVPFRLLNALRLHTEIGLVAAMAVAMATFSATPLVLAPLATEFEVSTATAALFSAAQLGSFVVGSWTAGRVVDPSRRLFVISLVTLSAALRSSFPTAPPPAATVRFGPRWSSSRP
ncbi:MAG: hypothetical protein EBY65_02050 [Acidimicrobiia bacterium]|nr:hypothetical protein [Acidimicrobiia bacterium]